MLLAIYHLHDRERLRARRETVTRSVVIGSGRDCDVVIGDDARVVARHLRLTIDPPAVEPIDGVVLVDGQPVEGPTPVRLGAPIQLGDTIVKLRPAPIVQALADLDRTNPPNRRLLPTPHHGAAIATPIELGRSAELAVFPSPPPLWRDQLAPAPDEHRFLELLRDKPSDVATRMLYAEWLESHGRALEAAFVRIEYRPDDPAIVRTSELDWRAITSRGPIEDCKVGEGDPDGVQCPSRWDSLQATRDERLRRCGVCNRDVRFCATIADAALAGRVGDRVVFDIALDDTDAYAAYHDRPVELPENTLDDPVSLPSIDTSPSMDGEDDPAFFTLDDESPPRRD
ncbi:MAG TPA: TIGR02996 domain-containing protein [Kofleriaceae bacterium]